MIHQYLIEDLIKEIENILKDIQTKNPSGETVVGVKGYEQALPVIMDDEEDETQFFPYFICRMAEGETDDDSNPWVDTVSILIGVYDDDKQKNGHRHIMTMIQRITDRFAKEPLLNKKFRAQEKMSFALQEPDPDTYPFFFGGVELKFSVPKIGRSDEWS